MCLFNNQQPSGLYRDRRAYSLATFGPFGMCIQCVGLITMSYPSTCHCSSSGSQMPIQATPSLVSLPSAHSSSSAASFGALLIGFHFMTTPLMLVPAHGFEPRLPESKSDVLPLDDAGLGVITLSARYCVVN